MIRLQRRRNARILYSKALTNTIPPRSNSYASNCRMFNKSVRSSSIQNIKSRILNHQRYWSWALYDKHSSIIIIIFKIGQNLVNFISCPDKGITNNDGLPETESWPRSIELHSIQN